MKRSAPFIRTFTAGPRIVRRSRRRYELQLLEAAAALVGLTLLALVVEEAPAVRRFDSAVRRLATSPAGRRADSFTSALFPVGLPGVYIPIAHLIAWRLGRRGAPQSWRIPAIAWAAWLAHRGVKLVYERERPRGRGRSGGRKPRRVDSFPSGHTTGITALSRAIASVLSDMDALNCDEASDAERMLVRALAAAAPIVMGSQRLLADDHWASDVLGGLALGSAVAQSCRAFAGIISKTL